MGRGRRRMRIWRASAWWATACIGMGVTLTPAIAWAADLPAPTSAAAAAPAAYVPAEPDWVVTIGGELRIGPKWAGASDGTFRITGGPLFSIRKVGTPPEYFGPRDSFGFTILDLGKSKSALQYKSPGRVMSPAIRRSMGWVMSILRHRRALSPSTGRRNGCGCVAKRGKALAAKRV